MDDFANIILKPGKEQSVRRYHPWIFSGAMDIIEGNPAEGDIVRVFDSSRQFLCLGHYQPASIAVRIFSFENIKPDYKFWKNKIEKAYEFRKIIGLADNDQTNVFRLVNAEGDNLPGLVIDFYNGTSVIQAHSVGMYNILDYIKEALKEVLKKKLKAIYNKSEETLPHMAKNRTTNNYLFGIRETNTVLENNNEFNVNWEEGQKTGFYIDQRENRKLVMEYSKDRKVLNLFGYTGGFSVYSLRGGAGLVHTVDSSNKAINLANENIELNFGKECNHQAFIADAMDYLGTTDNQYDLMIIDPPAFAKHLNALENALQAYKRLNANAIKKIMPGGIIFTFSCSQVVSKENFRKSVFAAAANIGRRVRILHQLTQPHDHPVSIYHPEGEYLKGLVLYVE